MTFQSFYKRTKDLDPSGVTNIGEVALELYKTEVGAEFVHVSAWQVISKCPKQGNVDTKRGRKRTCEDQEEVLEVNKKAKQRAVEESSKDEALLKL